MATQAWKCQVGKAVSPAGQSLSAAASGYLEGSPGLVATEPSRVLLPSPGQLQELVGEAGLQECFPGALPGGGRPTEAARAFPLCRSGPTWTGPGGRLGTQHLPWARAVVWPEDSWSPW